MVGFSFDITVKLLIIGILLLVFVYLIFANVPKVISSFEEFLGISSESKEMKESSSIEKYIVCAYKACTEGINNKFCNDAGLTPYNPKIDKVFDLLGIQPPTKICAPSSFSDQFPIVIHVKSGTEIRKDKINSLSEGKIKCINSDKGDVWLFVDEFSVSNAFSITKDNSNDCKTSHYTPVSIMKTKKDITLYLWVEQNPYTNKISVKLEPYALFINLTDKSSHEDEIFAYTSQPSLHRIFYNGKDYFIYFCPKSNAGGNCVYPENADNNYAYDVKICSINNDKCITESYMKKGIEYPYWNIGIRYNGIQTDSNGYKYIGFTVRGY